MKMIKFFTRFFCVLAVTCLGTIHLAHGAGPFNLDQLLKIVEQRKVSTLDKALALLPEDLLSSYTLLYDSKSLQRATSSSPRVILFGTDAKFIAAFGGESELTHLKDLEIT